MGCCEPKNVLQFNTETELIGKKINRKIKLEGVTYPTQNMPNTESKNSSFSSPRDFPNKDIPQFREICYPQTKIPNEIIATGCQLQLTIFESKFLQEGLVLHINPGGLISSERQEQDGITYFGNNNRDKQNDFNFPEDDSNIAKRHFQIKYDISSDEYKVKNISGTGLYIRIQNKRILNNNATFSFSISVIDVKIAFDPEKSTSRITLEVLYGQSRGKRVSYSSDEKKVIKFGRVNIPGLDLEFNDENVSRCQCMIFYESENNNWWICDGDGKKPSSNGTWYLAEEYNTIEEGMIFRAGTTSFIAHLIKNN